MTNGSGVVVVEWPNSSSSLWTVQEFSRARCARDRSLTEVTVITIWFVFIRVLRGKFRSWPGPSAMTSARANKEEEIRLLRRPTWPTKHFHNLQEPDEPKPVPKEARTITKSKRLVESRPSSLVKEVQNSAGKRSSQIADELTTKYDLRPTETRAKINEVRVARQARKSFATEIRQHLHLDADKEERRWFLTWLEEECARAEWEESDEMV